jgi:hypothetical protein
MREMVIGEGAELGVVDGVVVNQVWSSSSKRQRDLENIEQSLPDFAELSKGNRYLIRVRAMSFWFHMMFVIGNLGFCFCTLYVREREASFSLMIHGYLQIVSFLGMRGGY